MNRRKFLAGAAGMAAATTLAELPFELGSASATTPTYSWLKVIDGGGRPNATAADPHNPGRFMLMGDVWGPHETVDGCQTFVPVGAPGNGLGQLYGRAAAYSLKNPGVCYIGTGNLKTANGCFATITNGVFQQRSTKAKFGTSLSGSPASVMPRSGCGRLIHVDLSSDGLTETITALTPAGLLQSTDGGVTWSTLSSVTAQWKALAPDGAGGWLCATYRTTKNSGSKIYHVANGSTTVMAGPGAVNDLAPAGSLIYAACGTLGLQVYNGSVFKPVAGPFGSIDVQSVDAVGSTIAVACAGAKSLVTSHDSGATWTVAKFNSTVLGTTRIWWLAGGHAQPGGSSFQANQVSLDPSNPNMAIVAATGGGYATTDGGATVQPAMHGSGGDETNGIRLGPAVGQVTVTDTDWTGITTTDGWNTYKRTTSPGTCPSHLSVSTSAGTLAVTSAAGGDITLGGHSIADQYAKSAIACKATGIAAESDLSAIYISTYGGVLRGTRVA